MTLPKEEERKTHERVHGKWDVFMLTEVFVSQKRLNVNVHTVKMASHDDFVWEPAGKELEEGKEWKDKRKGGSYEVNIRAESGG